jgi:hypothetical protein
MRYVKSGLPAVAVAMLLAACSSGHSGSSSPPPVPPAATAMVGGTIVDEIIINSTVTAYQVSSAGVVGACIASTPATTPASCATATSDSQGNYSVNLGNYTGAALLQATGGSYTDIGTGQTVTVPSSETLSVLLPSVAPGSSTIPAQITPLTTIAAQLTLQQASQGTALATAATAVNTAVAGYFGGLTNLVSTALVDLGQADCGTAATTQATYDASLVLAGIAELATAYKVNSLDLAWAIYQDAVSDGRLDGLAAGAPIMVPLSAGGGSVALTTIYGSGLAQSIAAAIPNFESSIANACKANLSSTTGNALRQQHKSQLTNPQWSYSVSGTYTLSSPISTPVSFSMHLSLGVCSADQPPYPPSSQISLSTGSQQSFSFSTGANSNSYSPIDWTNSCGKVGWTLSLVNSSGQSCSIGSQSTTTGTFTSTDGGNTNTAIIPTNVTVSCSTNFYTVGGGVTGLAAGQSVTLADAANGDSVTINANGSFDLSAQLANGAPYNVTASPSTSTVTNGSGTIQNANVTNVAVDCAPVSSFTPDAVLSPQGMVFYKNQLYVANAGGNQVLIFSEQLNVKYISGITQVGRITTDVNNPVRLAIDANGFLYVANLGGSNGLGSVSVYDTNNNNAEVTAAGGGALISGISRPLGVAVDATGKVYVANNSANEISVYVPKTPGSPSAGFAAPSVLTADSTGDEFLAPGVIYESNLSSLLGSGNDYVLVGLGPSGAPNSVILYKAPFTSAPAPLYDLTSSACSTMPSGPTGIALYADTVDPMVSVIYVTSYYNGNVTQYPATSLVAGLTLGGGTTNPCPTPVTTSNGINAPEGVAVDTFGNVFVSNSAATGANANTIVAYTGGWSANNTAPSVTYHYP